MPHLRAAYVLLEYPRLTETFVADEIRAMRARGSDIQVVSLLSPRDALISGAERELPECTWYAPRPWSIRLWVDQLRFFFRSPGLYLRLLRTLLSQPYRGDRWGLFARRVVIFLKAVSAAGYLQDRNIELIHSHFAWLSGAAAWICARLLGVPFTVTVHAFDLYSGRNDLAPLIAREATHLVAISRFNKENLAKLRPAGAAGVSVVHCGVDLSRQSQPPGTVAVTSPNAAVRILSVGSLTGKKGHPVLIAACEILKQWGLEFHCTIVGGGPEEAQLRKQIASAGLDERVALLGALEHSKVLASYRAYDIFVLASVVDDDGDQDGIPVVLMEAGHAGLPAVSTTVSGIPELVRHQETGLLVPPGDPAALAEAIRSLARDPDLRARLGRNASALVKSEFDLQGTAARLEQVFSATVQRWKEQSRAS